MLSISDDGLLKVLEVNEQEETIKVQFRDNEPEWCKTMTGPDGDLCFKVSNCLVYSFAEMKLV